MTDICTNRKARHEYHVIETKEAGIVLQGTEVKSCRQGGVSLEGSYATVRDGELWLISANIEEYSFGNRANHEPKRDRKLLLKKREIADFASQAEIKGYTIVPLRMYFSEGRVKVEIAVCKGKQAHDKRESLKKKDQQREIRDYR